MKDNGGQLRGGERVWGVGAAHVAERVECYDKFLWHRSAQCYLSWVGSSGLLPASMSLLSLNLIIQEAWSARAGKNSVQLRGEQKLTKQTSYLCPLEWQMARVSWHSFLLFVHFLATWAIVRKDIQRR